MLLRLTLLPDALSSLFRFFLEEGFSSGSGRDAESAVHSLLDSPNSVIDDPEWLSPVRSTASRLSPLGSLGVCQGAIVVLCGV